MKRTLHQEEPQPAPPEFGLKTVAALVGCVFASLSLWWIACERIDYSTGPTELHHFVATPTSSPGLYWTLVLIFGVGAFTLWSKVVLDFVAWIRTGRSLG